MSGLTRWAWVLGLVGATAGVGFAVRTALLGGVDGRGSALAVAAAVLLLAYAALDREPLTDALQARSTRQVAATTTLIVGAAIACVLAYTVVRGMDTTVDSTARRQHALSGHTRAVLQGLDTDVVVRAYFPTGSPDGQRFEALVRRYAQATGRLTTTAVDPLRNPLEARADGVTLEAGEVVIAAGERTVRLRGRFTEDALTDALVRLTSEGTATICWPTGRGEGDPDAREAPLDFGLLVLELEATDHEVRPVEGTELSGCDVVLWARPTAPPPPALAEAMVDHVAGGGSLWVLTEPGIVAAVRPVTDRLGILLPDPVVLDPDPARSPMGAQDPSLLVVPEVALPDHPITAGLVGGVLLRVATEVALADGVSGDVLLAAGPQSWAETDLDDLTEAFSRDPDERSGSVPLAVARTLDGGGRLVVFGDAGFAANQGLGWGANRDLALDVVAWSLGREDRLGTRPDAPDTLALSGADAVWITLLVLGLGPGVPAALGVATWWRRRRR